MFTSPSWDSVFSHLDRLGFFLFVCFLPCIENSQKSVDLEKIKGSRIAAINCLRGNLSLDYSLNRQIPQIKCLLLQCLLLLKTSRPFTLALQIIVISTGGSKGGGFVGDRWASEREFGEKVGNGRFPRRKRPRLDVWR